MAAAAPPVGDWLVVPGSLERGYQWGRIVAVIDDPPHPVHYRVRWWGDAHDTVVLPPPDARIESAGRWPQPGGDAFGLWPAPDDGPAPAGPAGGEGA